MTEEQKEPCKWLEVEVGKNSIFRTLIYTFISILICIAGYGVHLNLNTGKEVAALQADVSIIKKFMFNAFTSSSTLADVDVEGGENG